MSDETNKTGNLTGENEVKKANIEGYGDVYFNEDANNLVVTIPQEVIEGGQDAIDKFQRKTEDYIKVGGKNYKDRMDLKKQRTDFDDEYAEKKAELAEMNKQIAANKAPEKLVTKVKTLDEILEEELGEDFADAYDDNPRAVAMAQQKQNRMELDAREQAWKQEQARNLTLNNQRQSLNSSITNDGFNVSDVERTKLQMGFKDDASAYKFMKSQLNSSPNQQRSTLDIINKSEQSKKVVSFVNAGNAQPQPRLDFTNMTAEQVSGLTDNQKDLRYQQLLNEG